ncbi:hypothetical protein OIU77_012105 [Salix suchowensis]|uniref:Peroxidase n=1 Tax=Salix suchowensis TaxID=1278906 RepID=A0ABQ9A2P0_9ROSI|nr:hypothetical protein OIU77_012105 [Salix suchowensis]
MAFSLQESKLPILPFSVLIIISILGRSLHASDPPLTLDHYAPTCPSVFEIVKKEMECEVRSDPRNAALIVRLHFHDCFVQGCDGSVLLDDTITLQGEKKASASINSLGGFQIIDRIKNKVESECPGIVSCADILTIAARDAVLLVGGPYWDVPVGRKDSKTASLELAESNIPTADESLLSIINKFLYQGLSVTDLVALSGAHTIGSARCATSGGGDNNISAMDYVTPNLFDNSFYHLLLKGDGLLNSDQELYSSMLGLETKNLVVKYAHDQVAFFQQFSYSMVKMGNITNPDSFVNGEIRTDCRFVNA